MSLSIGLGVGSTSVRMVGTRDRRIVWAGEVPLDDATSLEMAVHKLLASVNAPRWQRVRVSVAIGPAHSQTKRIEGLPQLSDPHALERVVSESAGRFFLRNGIPLLTTSVRIDAPGVAWAAALEEPVIRDVARACIRRGFALMRFVPAAAVVGALLEGDLIVWPDGDVASEIEMVNGVLVGIRRVSAGRKAGCATPAPIEELRSLGDEGWRFADAFGAATMPAHQHLTLRLGVSPGNRHPSLPRWRLPVASIACAVSTLGVLLAPGLAASRASRQASTQVAALASQRATAARAEADLRQVTAALNEISDFAHRRRSPTLFLGALTETLPSNAQVVSIHLDTLGGNLVVLAPGAATLLADFEKLADVISPEIVGPVTREMSGSLERERVTIRFKWSPIAARAHSALATRPVRERAMVAGQ